ncbi:MAG: RNA methyltransferase, partial [Candidatus Nanopelagicales bacterium]
MQLRRRIEPAGGFFMAESEKVIRRAVTAGCQPRSVLTSDRWLPAIIELLRDVDAKVYLADDLLIQEVAGYRVHRGALAAMHRPLLQPVDAVIRNARRLVVLEGIVDHTNVGAAFRSVAALGFDAIVIDSTCADPLYRRSVRVSMGTVLTLPWTRAPHWPRELGTLKAAGFTTVALTPASDAPAISALAETLMRRARHDFDKNRIALVLGAEGDGLSSHVMTSCDERARIPMAF